MRTLTLFPAVSDSRVEAIWRQIVDVFRGGLLADWYALPSFHPTLISRPLSTAAESLPLDAQDAEENFDLALLSTLEVDVLPHLGSARVPDYVITQFARILYAASALHADGTREDGASDEGYATTESAQAVPRERFAYWAFDLLVLVCAVVETGESCAL